MFYHASLPPDPVPPIQNEAAADTNIVCIKLNVIAQDDTTQKHVGQPVECSQCKAVYGGQQQQVICSDILTFNTAFFTNAWAEIR